MDTGKIKKSMARRESRRGFLKKSGQAAAGAAALPIVMSLRADAAIAKGSVRKKATATKDTQ